MSDTGNTATFVLGTTGAVGNIQSMVLPEWLLQDIDDSHLGTTDYLTYTPGDLTEPGEIVADIIFDASIAVPSNGTVETGTLTFPLGAGGSVAATLIGTGYIKRYKIPDLANNQLNVGQLTFKLDGKTGPTYTAQT